MDYEARWQYRIAGDKRVFAAGTLSASNGRWRGLMESEETVWAGNVLCMTDGQTVVYAFSWLMPSKLKDMTLERDPNKMYRRFGGEN